MDEKRKEAWSKVPATKEAMRAFRKTVTLEERREFLKNTTPKQNKAAMEYLSEEAWKLPLI